MGEWQAVTLSVVVATSYLFVLRLVDVNEREPIWALALLLVCGFVGGSQLRVLAAPGFLDLTVWPAIVARELVLLAVLSLAFAGFAAIERWRGWSEVTDVMDGLVYGSAAGLGLSVGDLFVRELSDRSLIAVLTTPPGPWRMIAAALTGLASGVAGAMIGAAIVAARDKVSLGMRVLRLAGGLAAAAGVLATVDWLAHGDALSGDSSLWRAWAALLLPLAALAAATVYELRVERRVLAALATSAVLAGVADESDLRLLTQPLRRMATYASALARGHLRACRLQMSLHNRLVQLVMLRRRIVVRPSDRLASSEQSLRASIALLRRRLAAEVRA